jgi:hypothetical protein
MAGSLQGKVLVKQLLAPVSVTSDGAAGVYVDYNGYNRALVIVSGGLVATGDSDDTITLTVSKVDDIAAASAAASDEVVITAAVATLGPVADTDTALGVELIDIDFVAHSLDNGCLTIDGLASEGGAAVCSATIILYEPTGTHTDTAMTITVPASS